MFTHRQINDRYEFEETLDLDVGDRKYLSKDSDTAKRNKYKLHSVLVHSGGTHGGHYYAYSRPDGQTWLRFDDEKVFTGHCCWMCSLSWSALPAAVTYDTMPHDHP
jgi:ubiquitin C-terminal hydrolase